MNKKTLIIYIEGQTNTRPKQEANLFEMAISRRYWARYFKSIGYVDFKFIILPYLFSKKDKLSKDKRLKNLDRNIYDFTQPKFYDSTTQNFQLKILVTGDHDELKNIKTLEAREQIANELATKYNEHDVVVILKRDKKFKIELIMEEIVGKAINKKILKQQLGTECPTFDQLLKLCDSSQIKNNYVERLAKSKHPLFQELNK